MTTGVGVARCPARPALLIRELTPADRPALTYLFGHLGERSRYQRFLTLKRELSRRDLDRLTDVDHWHREAVIAYAPAGRWQRAPIGVARYVRGQDFDIAEVAVTVVDDWQRCGVGSELVAVLRDHAVRAGIRRVTATVLRDNRGALALTRQFGGWTVLQAEGESMEIAFSWR
jgi:RimJ/RimL family protein N-acetyltransferase